VIFPTALIKMLVPRNCLTVASVKRLVQYVALCSTENYSVTHYVVLVIHSVTKPCTFVSLSFSAAGAVSFACPCFQWHFWITSLLLVTLHSIFCKECGSRPATSVGDNLAIARPETFKTRLVARYKSK